MTTKQPTARIACHKSVLKIYNGKHVYLENEQEFEIELFNPTTNTIAAEVYLNDQRAFTSMLVLRPGQRFFLDCNPDTKKRFKFETYTVSGTNQEVKEAIKNNGKVEVKFYREATPSIPLRGTYCPPSPYFPRNPWNSVYYTNNFGTGGTQLPPTFTTNSISSNSATYGLRSMDFLSKDNLSVNFDSTKDLETGRIEAGSQSNQDFNTVDNKFETWAFYSTAVQIFPVSQKPIETTSIRTYCTNCGIRNRNEWKFCPKCGAKF